MPGGTAGKQSLFPEHHSENNGKNTEDNDEYKKTYPTLFPISASWKNRKSGCLEIMLGMDHLPCFTAISVFTALEDDD